MAASPDKTPIEQRDEENAHRAAVFWRKLLAENFPPLIAQGLVQAFVQTLLIGDAAQGGGKKEPWE